MDEGKSTSDGHLEEILAAVLVLFVLLKLFSALPNLVSEKLGTDGTFIAKTFGLTPSLNANTPIGSAIVNKKDSTLYSEPGGGEILGEKKKGEKGVLIGGPVLRDGELWWQVRYDDGSEGWVHQDDLGVDIERDRAILKENTPHGTKVKNIKPANIFSTQFDDGLIVGRANIGDKGVIIGGPAIKGGERWWQVRYSNGTSGWVPESSILVDVEKNIRGVNDGTPIGTEVVTIRNTRIWDAPRFGSILGTQPKDSRGRLVDGSVTAGTIRWWYVEFELVPSGWVYESDLERRFPLSEKASSSYAFLKRFSFTISIILFAGIIFVFSRLRHEISKEYHMFKPTSVVPEERVVKNTRWERVLEHVDSDNPNDWRLAVLEADILLDDIVESMYLPGDTLGERLKAVERSDFQTIDEAWEAHKVRNRVAHAGGDYILTQREAKRVVNLYRKVFEEFHAI